MSTSLVPRVPAGSVEELVAGASHREPLDASDAKSGSVLERVVIDGDRFVLKHLHPDGDWTMRGFGDVGCRPVLVWTSGLLDAIPPSIDHAVVGAAAGIGRNGWGGALLLRDVSEHLVPAGDAVLPLAHHRQLLDHLADLAAAFWAPTDLPELLSLESRWTAFGPGWLAAEARLGWPDAVPRIAAEGWARFAQRAPQDVVTVVEDLRADVDPLVRAVRRTPLTFIHGDWKLGNLGVAEDRTILLDWTYPGTGPIAHDLAWYLALNRSRLPESKEASIDALRASLERRSIATEGWWEQQVSLCLLGALVQFGWEKALGDDDEPVGGAIALVRLSDGSPEPGAGVLRDRCGMAVRSRTDLRPTCRGARRRGRPVARRPPGPRRGGRHRRGQPRDPLRRRSADRSRRRRGDVTVDRGRRPPAVVADGRRLPISTGTVGAVVAAFAYNHVPDPEAALADAARVLRSDGFVLASVYADDDHHPAKGVVEVAAHEAGWRPERWVDDLMRAMPLLATPERAVAVAEQAGLAASATVISVAFPQLRATDLVAWRLGMASLAPFVAALPAGRRQALRDRALELVGQPEPLVRRMVVLRVARC